MILYEVTDNATGEIIGHITGAQLRNFAGVTDNTPVFNQELVTQFNQDKKSLGEPERLRSVLSR